MKAARDITIATPAIRPGCLHCSLTCVCISVSFRYALLRTKTMPTLLDGDPSFATGRTPNVKGIGLENTTLKLDSKGVPSFDPLTTQTVNADGTSPIFIAGDTSNFIPLLHEAADEGRIAGGNAARLALGKQVNPGLRRAPIGVVFTDLKIGIVGGGFHSMKPGTFATGQVSFEDQGRARILFRNKGLLNVYGDLATGRFLGAEMLAPGAEHLAHLLAWALQAGMTVAQMLEMPFYHPVIE